MLHLQTLLADAEQMSELFSHASIWILMAAVLGAVVRAARRSRTSTTAAAPAATQAPQHPTEP